MAINRKPCRGLPEVGSTLKTTVTWTPLAQETYDACCRYATKRGAEPMSYQAVIQEALIRGYIEMRLEARAGHPAACLPGLKPPPNPPHRDD